SELAERDDCLICWDAPLTGPYTASNGKTHPKAFSRRPIEAFFGEKNLPYKPPKGISVLPYCGCPHWAMSQNLLGYPRIIQNTTTESSPFKLITTSDTPTKGRYVVEVHPALALWLWCKDTGVHFWEYKKNRTVLNQLWSVFSEIPDVANTLGEPNLLNPPKNDDEFDALISYTLGKLWLHDPTKVILHGDERTGAILLPNIEGIELENSFRAFLKNSWL